MKLEEEQLKEILHKLNEKYNIQNKKYILFAGLLGLGYGIYNSNLILGLFIGGGVGYVYNKYIYN